MVRKNESTVASQWVADLLAQRILSGELKPGEHIKQDDLASELSISRIPVRDALRILETRGLVSLRANFGARVTSLTVRDMEISYQIRESLEPQLLAESLPGLTEADIDELRDVKAGLDSAKDIKEFMPLSHKFHWTAFSRHNAPLLAGIVERLWDTTESYRRLYAHFALKDPERMRVMRAERDLLFGAIERREVDLAPRILGMHIRRTHMALLDFKQFHGVLGDEQGST